MRGGCWAFSEVVVGLSAGFVLRARAARDCARRRARAHRHGRVELVVDLGLDRIHLSLVQPLGFRLQGRRPASGALASSSVASRADAPPG